MRNTVPGADDCLIVDISDALSERDRVRFTVQTKTKLPHFTKPSVSVVRQHEEFIWLHDCLEDNDDYAGYIIPPGPPKPDFDASREKLQRLGDGERNMTKEEFAKMKQELEAEYLAIFKKTVAMHEIFLQRLAAHEKFRLDLNFKIFLEYENELSVRCKNKKEKLSGFIQNISKSAHDLVITTSQVAASSSTSALFAGQSPSKIRQQTHAGNNNNNTVNNSANGASGTTSVQLKFGSDPSQTQSAIISSNSTFEQDAISASDDIKAESEEHYFQRERLLLVMYYKSIRETANNSERVTLAQKCVAESYLQIAQQLIKLAAIEIVPITDQTKDSSNFLKCPLPSLTLPSALEQQSNSTANPTLSFQPSTSSSIDSSKSLSATNNTRKNGNTLDSNSTRDTQPQTLAACANTNRTSDGLKQFLLYVADYLEHARKIESRIASDEDLKVTDTFLYYKRETSAASDLIARRQRFMAEYETATRNLEKSRQKARGTNMQYADVIQKQARENFILISRLAKGELIDYKERRVAAFRKAFGELVELELKQLRSHSQLLRNCLSACLGLKNGNQGKANPTSPTSSSSAVGTAIASTSPIAGTSQQQHQQQQLPSLLSASSKPVTQSSK